MATKDFWEWLTILADLFQILLKLLHHSECFFFLICKNPSRYYWKVENLDYVSSHSKNFQSKLTIKIKNRCKFWRIRSTPQTKPWLVIKPTMAFNRIFVPCFTWLWETIFPNWKRDSLHSFWSRTFPWIFLWL